MPIDVAWRSAGGAGAGQATAKVTSVESLSLTARSTAGGATQLGSTPARAIVCVPGLTPVIPRVSFGPAAIVSAAPAPSAVLDDDLVTVGVDPRTGRAGHDLQALDALHREIGDGGVAGNTVTARAKAPFSVQRLGAAVRETA